MTSTADMTQHPDVSEISDLTEGLLSPARTADVREHLDGCPLCADVRASLDEIRGLLGTLPGASPMPADIVGRIDAALAAEALLDSTAPIEAAAVSRETAPAAAQPPEAPSSDRPAGHGRAATGPGRNRTRGRRRKAILGAAFGAAAVGMSVLLLQSVHSTSDKSASATKDAGASTAEEGASQDFAKSGLQGRVQALVHDRLAQNSPRIDKGPSQQGEASTISPMHTDAMAVPPCIQKGTGRTEAPIAAAQGEYKGDKAYLVVLPHSTDSQQIQAYVIDATCVDAAPSSQGKVLLTNSYPRR